MKIPDLSIIVPICNVEKYLDEAIGSLINQTLNNIEIVLVNDGSIDNSGKICENYAKKDNRIVYIDQIQNYGYGVSCNTGIKKSSGNYITIFESDDFIKTNAYKSLYSKAIKHDVDIIRFGFCLYENGKERPSSYLKHIESLSLPVDKVFNPLDFPDMFPYQPTVWGFLYKRSFIVDNNIFFNETPGASYQDNTFYFKVFALAKSMIIDDGIYYYYRQHPEQSIHNKSKVNAPLYEMNAIKDFFNNTFKETDQEAYKTLYLQFINRTLDYFNLHFNRLDLELKKEFFDSYLPFFIDTIVQHEESNFFYHKLDNKRKNIYNTLLKNPTFNNYLLNEGFYFPRGEMRRRNKKSIYNQRVSIKRLTPAYRHFLYGYFDLQAMDRDEKKHLALNVPFMDHLPGPDDTAQICLIDDQGEIEYLEETSAWCFQQSNFLQFRPGNSSEIIYNIFDKENKKYKAVIYNLKPGLKKQLPLPVANVSPDGKKALSINFSRLYDYRPGYGYCNIPDRNRDIICPEDDGIFKMDIDTGDYKLIISYKKLWELFAKNTAEEKSKILVNHINFNTDGTRFIFLLRFFSNNPPWPTYTITADADGSNIKKIFGFGSHYHWKDSTNLALSGANVFHKKDMNRLGLYEIDAITGIHKEIDDTFFIGDGHCSYSPDRKYLLYDSYTSKKFPYRKLQIFDVNKKYGVILAYLLSDPDFYNSIDDCRCDLHPRWSPCGNFITFDSIHEGFRGIYQIEVREAIYELSKDIKPLYQHEITKIISGNSQPMLNKSIDSYTIYELIWTIGKKVSKRLGVFQAIKTVIDFLNIKHNIIFSKFSNKN